MQKAWFALLAAVMLSGHVIGDEDRQYLGERNERIFAAVGQVACRSADNGNTFSNTATLVQNPYTVITVGHFLTNSNGYIHSIDECEFRIYSADGTSYIAYPIERHVAALDPQTYVAADMSVPDWAVLTLREPVPEDVAQPMHIRQATIPTIVGEPDAVLVAYPNHEIIARNRRIMSPDCIFAPAGMLFTFQHTCDANRGASGGLFYALDRYDRIVAIGMNFGESIEGPNVNYGQPFMNQMLENLPVRVPLFEPQVAH